eukprot:g5209.t1
MEEMMRHMQATLIQQAYRGMQGRTAFHVKWSRRLLFDHAAVIQSQYRARLGRRRAAATARKRNTEFNVRMQRHDNAVLMRWLGAKTRESQ